MYKIIGADGKEYGPITADILKQWIAQGRVNGQTKIRLEGATDWRTLAEIPELAAALPVVAAPPGPATPPGLNSATDQVNGPGIGLIVTGALNVVLGLLRVIISLTGFGLGAFGAAGLGNDEMAKVIMSVAGTTGIVLGALCAICGGITVLGGLKLRKLQSHGLVVTACILAIIPCTSPCCLVGLPIGIWALVVMSKPEVKSQFT
jgi:hypothetical protein